MMMRDVEIQSDNFSKSLLDKCILASKGEKLDTCQDFNGQVYGQVSAGPSHSLTWMTQVKNIYCWC